MWDSATMAATANLSPAEAVDGSRVLNLCSVPTDRWSGRAKTGNHTSALASQPLQHLNGMVAPQSNLPPRLVVLRFGAGIAHQCDGLVLQAAEDLPDAIRGESQGVVGRAISVACCVFSSVLRR